MKIKKESRKDQLIRLAAKAGWYDGNAGRHAEIYKKTVMNPGSLQKADHTVPLEEAYAYWIGYEEGLDSLPDDKNPYGKHQ